MKKLFTSSALWSCLIALAMMTASQSAWAEYVKLTALDGWNAWSGGGEEYPSLVDANIQTKWGTWFQPQSEQYEDERIAYIIVKAEKAVKPDWYFLVTGNDTGSNPGRNWKSWKIYGGNFAADADAVRNGEGWTLIDNKEDEPLPAQNFGVANLQFDYMGSEEFQYFWIEILDAVEYSGDDYDVYLQMSEWGLGTYGDLEKYLKDKAAQGTTTDEPVEYTVLDGTKMTGGENLLMLFDGRADTKWGNSLTNRQEGETTNGAFFVIKASRSMAPTYYALTTANDTQQYSGRNWKQWQIYGMNAESDEAVTRNSDAWVALDKKYNIGPDQLPAANFTQVFFAMSEGVTESYRYFKLELDQIVSSGDYMQMAEFALGDEYTIALDAAALAESAGEKYDPDLFAPKSLLDEFAALIEAVKACTDPFQLGSLNASVDAKVAEINAAAANYAELITARNQAIIAIDDGTLTDAAVAYLTAWISETDPVAPGDGYPCGNFAYIKANRQLSGDEARAEATRISAYIINNAATVDDPIYATYEVVEGFDANGFNDGEMGHSLIDGDRENTKWCASTDHRPWRLVFKSSEPIKPTYYGLVTGGDTYSYPGRNWKTWKIWAANFDSDADVTEGSENWVLIDEKTNIGSDILHTENVFESYINLSIGCAEPYQYFKIEVIEAASGNLIQMNELTFYNLGNLQEYRQEFIEEFADYNPEDMLPAYMGYINEYKAKYEELCNTVNAPDLMVIKNELTDLQSKIETSNELYSDYDFLVDDVKALSIDAENLGAWHTGYLEEEVAPCAKYIRGTYNYIMSNYSLDNDAIQAEMQYLQRIIDAVSGDLYILLDGHTVGEWGDGFYGNLIDGIALNTTETDPETGEEKEVKATKWGGQADAAGNTYIIFRTYDPVNPFFYTLTTGNDTQSYPGRNWGTWYIYGANFEGDGDATKDAEGWVLVDAKENVGQDRLHPVNAQPSYFGFSTETTVPYTYYKVVVTKAYEGNAIQMNELHFGTTEEFEAIKAEYTKAANGFDTEVVAQKSLIEDYEAAIPAIDECMNMEALFRANYVLETLREQIEASAATYAAYKEKAEETKAYLDENALTESEALTTLLNYLNEDLEASDLYPNGTFAFIYDEHVVNDSIVRVEIEFLQTLKAAAVAAGYGKGMVITDIIVNPTFAKAGEMLKDEKGTDIGRKAEGWDGYIYRTAKADDDKFYAAEFCNVNAKFDVSQTLTNLKNGYYKVTLNAGYRPIGDKYSYNYAAMAYANDVKTYVPAIREDLADEDTRWKGVYDDKPVYEDGRDPEEGEELTVEGYAIWGCEGAANAFAQGRFAITMIAQVTDGTLTIGVKNDGIKGNEWTAVGNFGLVYLGETSDEPDFFKESTEYNAYRITTLTETYTSVIDDLEDYSDAPNFAAAQKDALKELSGVATYEAAKTVGEIMQAIYETKPAYLALFDATEKVYAKWSEYSNEKYDDAVYDVRANIDEGAYADAEAAYAAKDKLYADWPDYLEMTGSGKVTGPEGVDIFQDEFGFDIVTAGTRPYLSLHKFYEPLENDEVILTFEYTAEQDIENGLFMYETPQLMTDVKDQIPTLPAATDWTKVYYNVTAAVKAVQFGSAVDHGIRWYINYNATAEDVLKLKARNFRVITKAQMNAEGGRPLNMGDVNGDYTIDIADAVAVLNAMAGREIVSDADVNGDGVVDIADAVAVLNIMAGR